MNPLPPNLMVLLNLLHLTDTPNEPLQLVGVSIQSISSELSHHIETNKFTVEIN